MFGEGYIYTTSTLVCSSTSGSVNLPLFSWDSIRQTVDVTDDELTAKYRNSALYATLACGPKYVLEPNRALAIPSTTDIASRWPGLPPDQVEAVERDFAAESSTLEGLQLENDYKRVKELVAQDAENF